MPSATVRSRVETDQVKVVDILVNKSAYIKKAPTSGADNQPASRAATLVSRVSILAIASCRAAVSSGTSFD